MYYSDFETISQFQCINIIKVEWVDITLVFEVKQIVFYIP